MANVKAKGNTIKCEDCQTTHGSEIDYNNHVAGNKHKRKVARQQFENQFKARKELHEKKGIFVTNLPPNTQPVELLAYISSFGKIDKSKVAARFAKVLFADEQSAINFKKEKHIFKNRTLRTGSWIMDIPTPSEDPKEEDKEKQIHDAVAKCLATNMNVDQQINTLQHMVLMSPSQVSSCHQLCRDLCHAMHLIYGSRFSIHMFGSVVTGLALKTSDLDVVVDTNFTLHRYMNSDVTQESFRIDKKAMNKVSNILKKNFIKVVPIFSAKIPIVKCIHRATSISCDVSFSNVTGVQNSLLIQCYVQSDYRVKELLVILKYWAKYFGLTKSCFSNYALIMMGLHYLMQLDNSPIPPVIHLQRNAQRRLNVDGWNCSFDAEHNFTRLDSTVTILDLLQGFFEFYAHFDYGMYVICPFIGEAIPKFFFKNIEQLPPGLLSTQSNQAEALEHMASLRVESNICVQDPFILNRNITGLIRGDFSLKIQRMFLCSGRVLKEDCVKNGTKGFLTHLLQRRTEDLLLIPSYWRQPISNNVEIELKVDCYVPTFEPHADATVEDARNSWYDRVYTVIKNDIFERSFLFEIDDDNISPTKKRKKALTKDEDSEVHSELRRIVCKREGPDLYSNRKYIAKEIASSQKMSFVEIQETVSKHMMGIDGPVETVFFMGCFHLVTQPTHIILELSDLGSSKNAFKSWVSYLEAHLPSWLVQLMPSTLKVKTDQESVTSPQQAVSSVTP